MSETPRTDSELTRASIDIDDLPTSGQITMRHWMVVSTIVTSLGTLAKELERELNLKCKCVLEDQFVNDTHCSWHRGIREDLELATQRLKNSEDSVLQRASEKVLSCRLVFVNGILDEKSRRTLDKVFNMDAPNTNLSGAASASGSKDLLASDGQRKG